MGQEEPGGAPRGQGEELGGTKKKPGAPMTYRIARNDFQIEFLNMQADAEGNPANHIHSALRTLPKDFGLAK